MTGMDIYLDFIKTKPLLSIENITFEILERTLKHSHNSKEYKIKSLLDVNWIEMLIDDMLETDGIDPEEIDYDFPIKVIKLIVAERLKVISQQLTKF